MAGCVTVTRLYEWIGFFFSSFYVTGFVSFFFSLWLYVLQRMEGDEEDSQRVKLSKQNGVRKSESEEERREMITPALRDALTKQGTARPSPACVIHSRKERCLWPKWNLLYNGYLRKCIQFFIFLFINLNVLVHFAVCVLFATIFSQENVSGFHAIFP